MCEIGELRKELAKLDADRKARNAASEAFKLENPWPKLDRTFTYRKSPAIKAQDVCSL